MGLKEGPNAVHKAESLPGSPEVPLPLRDRFLRWIGSVFGTSSIPQQEADQPNVIPVAIELGEVLDESISIPRSRLVGKSVHFPMPEGLQMSEGEFLALMNEFGCLMTDEIRERLNPTLQVFPSEVEQHLKDFVGKTANILSSQPAFREDWARFDEHWDGVNDTLVQQINRYLHPVGLHMSMVPDAHLGLHVDLYRILRSDHVEISDSEGAAEVPVVFLDESLIRFKRDRFFNGSYDHFAGIIFVNQGRQRVSLDNTHRDITKLGSTPRFGVPKTAGMYDDYLRGIIHHEAVHALLHARFPYSAGDKRGDGPKYPTRFVSTVGETSHETSGDFPFVAFDELTAIGAHLSIVDASAPIHHMGFQLDPVDKMPATYYLMRRLLPLITLIVAPDSPQRQSALRNLPAQGLPRVEEIFKVIGEPSFKNEDTRRVGEIMYRLGYSRLREANELFAASFR